MTLSLLDALRQVELKAGKTYECQVGNLRVEVRVKENQPDTLPVPMVESDVMLDPWTDLPAPQPVAFLQAAPGAPLLPDVPDIPTAQDDQ